MESTIMHPVKKWHTNDVLRGWDSDGEKEAVNDLPITRVEPGRSVVSIWKVDSLWQRIKFLFTGEITFQAMGQTHPPVAMYCGDIMVRRTDGE